MSRQNRGKATRLPEFFRPVLWSFNFSRISAAKDAKEIIVNTINYGEWRHLQWIADYYGKAKLKEIIENTPASEFQPPALELSRALFGVQKLKYATRGDKIKKQTDI